MQHGIDGWQLERLDWDPETGVAKLVYSHPDRVGEVEAIEYRPSRPEHPGWAEYALRRNVVLTLE